VTSRQQRRASKRRGQPAAAGRTTSPRSRGVNLWLTLALAVGVILAYAPAFSAPFVIDDQGAISASSQWKSLPGSPTAGRPLVMATLAINSAANRALDIDERPDAGSPDNAVGYRLFNLLIHLLTGALLFAVVRRAVREETIPESWRAIAGPIAGIVAALWLLHPIQSEVINYVVQRSESLASLFYLATLYSAQRAWDAQQSARVRWYAVAVVASVLGMMSKEIVISVPLAVMLYDRAFRLPTWRALLKPGNGRGWLYVALWISCLTTFGVSEAGARGASVGFNAGMTWYGYLYTQCWAIAHYLRLVVWPSPLSIDYGYQTVHGARGIPGLVLLSAFAIATIFAWTRAARFGWFAFLGSMFFMLLAPSSSVVPVLLEVAAERRIYLALAAVLILAVVAAEWTRRRFAPTVRARTLALGAATICVVFAITTAARSHSYTDPVALWRTAAAATPDNSRALGQLAWTLYRQPTPEVAAADSILAKAFAIDSECPGKCLEYGTVLASEGRFAQSVPLLEKHLEWDKGNVLAERLLALDLMKLGKYEEAIPYLVHVVQRAPRESHFVMLGVAYLSAGHRQEAVQTFRAMAMVDPGSEKLQNLSARLEDGTNHPEALSNLQDFAFGTARGWM
jgi:tetratricopeptide (TPR) repeat protein